MRYGRGFGDITEPVQYLDDTDTCNYQIKLKHDATFQNIINIICFMVISGIIVNTFAQLRDDKAVNDHDMQNKCYICNLDRPDDDSSGEFERHIQFDHNLWNYVYYMVYLDTKDSSDYDGVESFVAQSIDDPDGDISWVPGKGALCLKEFQEEDE